ncbi:MAG: hypothetical protein KDJ52_33855, partial [Anaerolineae bacterium]|nr:hypothetical protein [Anaerolineae bacterium]
GDTVLIENLSTSAYIEVQYQGAQVIIRSPNPFGTTLFAPSATTVRWERVDKDSNEVITSSASFIKQDDYITLTAPE